ncbi:MAG: DUF4271 domain-containing protein [Alistipes sp.]
MTDTLRHTVPVPLPRTQESGPASVREAATPLRSRLRPTLRHRHKAAARTVLRPIRPQKPRRTPPIRPKRRRAPCPARAIQPGTSHPNRTAGRPRPGARRGLAGGGYAAFRAAGSGLAAVLSLEGPLRGAADTLWRDAPADKVFGPASTLVPARILPAAPAPSLTENPVFQGFVLLLAATYAILLYRNLGDIRLLLTRVSHDTATGKRLMEDPGGSGFSHFLNVATAIGILFVGVMTVKYGDSLIPDSLIETLPQGAVLALSLLATFACLCVGIFQRGVVRLAGAVTLSQPFISQVVLLKRTYFTLAVIVTSPVLLLFALCPRGTGGVWFCIIVIELIVTAILYLREVLNLFISKKVSILHWILYLCIVEVFPVSLLWLLVAR